MEDQVWVPDPKPVPAELDPAYSHALYSPPLSVQERLEGLSKADLFALFRGGVGEPQQA